MDLREQVDLGPDTATRWVEGGPIHHRIHGPGVWPKETSENGLAGFKEVTMDYIKKVADFSFEFLSLVEEACGLKPGALDRFADAQSREGGQIKIVKYPPPAAGEADQGVGPHKDPFITFLVQGDDLPGLQVQNARGDWIDCTPIDECFVVNFGTLLETAT
jgi:isopenicillin N synthase-like dioxygenase